MTDAHVAMEYGLCNMLGLDDRCLEKDFDDAIADVLFGHYAIEVQHSPITSGRVEAKGKIYSAHGLETIWILHGQERFPFFEQGIFKQPHLIKENLHEVDEEFYLSKKNHDEFISTKPVFKLKDEERDILEIQGGIFYLLFNTGLPEAYKQDSRNINILVDKGISLTWSEFSPIIRKKSLFVETRSLRITSVQVFQDLLNRISTFDREKSDARMERRIKQLQSRTELLPRITYLEGQNIGNSSTIDSLIEIREDLETKNDSLKRQNDEKDGQIRILHNKIRFLEESLPQHEMRGRDNTTSDETNRKIEGEGASADSLNKMIQASPFDEPPYDRFQDGGKGNIEFTATFIKATDKAIKIVLPSGRESWIPKSQIINPKYTELEMKEGSTQNLKIPRWLFEKKNHED